MNSIDKNYAHAVLFLTVLTIPALLRYLFSISLRNGKITHKNHLIYFIVKKITPLLLTLILFPLQLHTQPTEPILKIETGMHTAPIIKMSIDKIEKYLVTCARDKTIRVWELRTGKLIKTLRYIDWGYGSDIYAVAISPDGRHIAAGGFTYDFPSFPISIYIFDTITGTLIKRLSGLPNVVMCLTYSKDGRYFVVGLGGANGIMIYKTDDYSLIKKDGNYEFGGVYSLDFSRDGKLVTTSYDGYIRLYDKNFNLVNKVKTLSGKKPRCATFSPDGLKIAIGYEDISNVDILSAYNLEKLYSVSVEEVSKCGILSVTFSHDGSYLYAAGNCQKQFRSGMQFIIRRCNIPWKGKYIDIPVANNTIFHLLSLKNGGVVFCSAEPSFGIVDANGKLTFYKRGVIVDLRGQWDEFKISHDGSIIRFGYEYGGRSPTAFDVGKRAFINELEVKLLKPITKIDGLKITDWKSNYYPKVNGKTIELDGEISRCLAISPDGQKFIIGTNGYLYLFDKNGDKIWAVMTPSSTWVVNISGNGKVAVAGFADGTIRWYRMEDGKELLAFFPHKDKKRWVIWTPKGYYDASPGGEDLIGWHINNRKDEADFFPVSRFRDRFYRPDIIAKIFTTYDEDKAIALANEESGKKIQETTDIKKILPPVVTIISPQENEPVKTKEITVRYIIRTPNEEPVTSVKFLIDGRPLSQQRGIGLKTQPGSSEEIREATLTIPQRDCEISIIAENKYSASEPATVRVKWVGESEEFVIKPKLYILSVGVSRYMDQSLKLQFASKDAFDFAEVMKNQSGKLYSDVVVKLLTDEKATKEEILDGLEWIQRETTSKDVAMIFLAGHGVNDPTGNFYFLPVNVDLDRLKRTGVPFYEIKTTIESIAGKVILFVDACHSGNVMGGRRGGIDITGVINELISAENGAVVFASSTGRQYSLEDPIWNNGAFTKALVEGLSGKADYTGKGKITINMLELYISERVKELTKGRQTPTVTKPRTIPDFPIAIVK
jgi:WD40 repeat protein